MKRIAAPVLLFLAGCSGSQDGAVAAALLASPPHPRLALCLSVDGADPSAALAAELRRAGRAFTPLSRCTRKGFYYMANGRLAERVTAQYARAGIGRANVVLSSYFAPLAAREWRVSLTWQHGRWVAERQRLESISMAPNNSSKPTPLRGAA